MRWFDRWFGAVNWKKSSIMAIYRDVGSDIPDITCLDIVSKPTTVPRPGKGQLVSQLVGTKNRPLRQRSVGCKLNPADYAITKKWADYLEVTMSQFIKAALALRVAEFEVAESRKKVDATKARV